jgi:hypothetical protein
MARNWNGVDLLDMVELYAEDNGWIASEDELSKRFDEEVLPGVIEHYSEDDSVAINEAFNDWTDMLCKDGEIHDEQYDKYCYVGRLADD